MDDNITGLWWGMYKDLAPNTFREACLQIIANSQYFPTGKEVLQAYKAALQREMAAAHERAVQQQNRLAAGKRERCYLCEDTGICRYTVVNPRNGYEYDHIARCTCIMGKNLSKFTRSNIDRSYIPELRDFYDSDVQAVIKQGKNPFYWPSIEEALAAEGQYALWEAGRKEAYMSQPTLTDEQLAIVKARFFAGAAVNDMPRGYDEGEQQTF